MPREASDLARAVQLMEAELARARATESQARILMLTREKLTMDAVVSLNKRMDALEKAFKDLRAKLRKR